MLPPDIPQVVLVELRHVFDVTYLVVEQRPLLNVLLRHVDLLKLRLRVVRQVDDHRPRLLLFQTPSAAPKEPLQERKDRNNVLCVVREVLVEVCKRFRVPNDQFIVLQQFVACAHPPEPLQIDDEHR